MSDLPKFLAGWEDEAREVLSWCKDTISQDRFDELAKAAPDRSAFRHYGGDSIIVLDQANSHLAVLNALKHAGFIVATQGEDGRIHYKTKSDA